jgi:transporter family protein
MSAFTLALLAALVWGAAAFCEKKGLGGTDPLTGLWVRSLGVTLGGLVVTFAIPDLGGRLAAMGWRTGAWLLGGGLLASIIGQIFFYRALKMGDIGRVATVGGSWPLVAFLLSVAFLGEPPTLRKALGVALVIAGLSFLR